MAIKFKIFTNFPLIKKYKSLPEGNIHNINEISKSSRWIFFKIVYVPKDIQLNKSNDSNSKWRSMSP